MMKMALRWLQSSLQGKKKVGVINSSAVLVLDCAIVQPS